MKEPVCPLNRSDALIAALLGSGALAIYTRTMAPDVLYGDSAELQTLVYTLGHTHSTGYPVYLLLARLVGFLPLNTPAWRVTFFSVLMGALTIAGVYLLSRMLTNSRAGAGLAAIVLALSYTMWSQAILAEVYAPGAAFLVWILLLTLRWHEHPAGRSKPLFAAGLLAGLSLGMHATTALASLPAAGFVLLWLIFHRAGKEEWRRALVAGIGGTALGVALWLVAFLYIDINNPPSSFINVMLYPSRSIWGLTPQDMDTPLERIVLTIENVQWRDLYFENGADGMVESFADYMSAIFEREFSFWILLFVLAGWWRLFSRSPWAGGYLLASFGLVFYFVLNYRPDDQFVFFLSSYIPNLAVAGVGFGYLITAPSQWRFLRRRGWGKSVSAAAAIALYILITLPVIPSRLPAIQDGVASFVQEDYQFPVQGLREPRIFAQMHLFPLPDDAVILMEWRDLYAVGYLAYVEGKKPGIRILEAMPRGNKGQIAESLVEEIHQELAAGRPVFAAQRFPGLAENFRLTGGPNHYVQVLPKDR